MRALKLVCPECKNDIFNKKPLCKKCLFTLKIQAAKGKFSSSEEKEAIIKLLSDNMNRKNNNVENPT